MEADAALIGADGGVELDAVAPVHLDFTVVVNPGHPEDDLPLRLHQALQHPSFYQVGADLNDRFQALQYFGDRLDKLRFTRIPLLYGCQHIA